MEIERTGVILCTERYEACVHFYRDTVGLAVLFATDELTCFDFGGSYLMVEREGVARPAGKNKGENPTCLRFNVMDVKRCAQTLRDRGIEVDYQEHSWGIIARFFDPDGNLCALRDEKSFAAQIVADV
jgi:lactoylglutathione lyase